MPNTDLRERIRRHQSSHRVEQNADHPNAARMIQVHQQITALSRKRDLDSDDEKMFVKLSREFDEADRSGIEQLLARGELRLEHGSVQPRDQAPEYADGGLRDRARRVIEQAHRSAALPDHAATVAEKLVTDGSGFSQSVAQRWAIAVGNPHYLTAFGKIAGDPVRGHLLWTPEEADAHRAVVAFQSESRAMAEGTGAGGGFLVPLTLDPSILLSSAGSINPLRRIGRVTQTVTNSWTGITSAGVTAEWKPESNEAADASPTLANPVIPVFLGDAFIPYSFEVGQDAAGGNFLGELQKLLVDGADQLQNTAYTLGTGTAQPKGVITALVGSASEINAAADDTFARGDVFTIQNALPARFSANAQWCAHLAIINLMSQMELSTGGSRVFPELAEGRLLNRPINELSNMDSTVTVAGAVSNFILLYGDFSNFVIADRIGTQMEFIPNLVGTNRRPTGQRGALMWFRSGSDVVVQNAFRLLDVPSAA